MVTIKRGAIAVYASSNSNIDKIADYLGSIKEITKLETNKCGADLMLVVEYHGSPDAIIKRVRDAPEVDDIFYSFDKTDDTEKAQC